MLRNPDLVGQQRMARPHAGRRDKFEVSPNLGPASGWYAGAPAPPWWATPTTWRRMRDRMELGIDRFILSGYPHLEKFHRFAELVFPKLPLRHTTGHDRGPAKNSGPFGEVIANVVAPSHRKAASAAS